MLLLSIITMQKNVEGGRACQVQSNTDNHKLLSLTINQQVIEILERRFLTYQQKITLFQSARAFIRWEEVLVLSCNQYLTVSSTY
jgi:hypothetical protein